MDIHMKKSGYGIDNLFRKPIEIWAFYYGKISNISNVYNGGTLYMMKVLFAS